MTPIDELILRRATSNEAVTVANVYIASRRAAFPDMPATIHSDDEIHGWVAENVIPKLETWIAERAGEACGIMVLDRDMLYWLFVMPAMQRRGVGARLLSKAKELRPSGLRLYVFQSNAPARGFYEARGFVAIAFGAGEDNEEHAPDALYEWTPH
ncbi:MAG TPA: GNAT family N-acetyltransferase [Candidatus Binataceae bacterium]